MVRGHSVFISETNVRDALNALIYTTQEPKETALSHLLLVNNRIDQPSMPANAIARRYALQNILIEIITDGLKHCRAPYSLELEPTSVPIDLIKKAILADYAQQNAELISWSHLYYRYVHVNLAGSLDFSDILSVDQRTVRRYLSHGVKRVTEKLIALETEARQQHHAQQLLSILPFAAMPKLYGRADELSVLQDPVHLPAHFLLTGPSGVGKTALIHAVLHHKITENAIDDLIWMDQPSSVEQIRRFLADQHFPLERQLIHTVQYKICLVFDHADTIFQGRDELLTEFLAEFSNAILFFTANQAPLDLPERLIHIPIHDLSRNEAESLIQDTLKSHILNDMVDSEEIWERVGGNPLAIRLFIQNSALCGSFLADRAPLEQIYDRVFHSLSPADQFFWVIMAILPATSLPYHTLASLTQAFALPPCQTLLHQLAQHHLLTVSDKQKTYGLIYSAQEYVRSGYLQQQPHIESSVHALLDWMVQCEDFTLFPDIFIESLLTATWISLPDGLHADWLERFFSQVRQTGYHLGWINAFDRYQQHNDISLTQQLMLGVCQRNIGEWDAAQKTFSIVFQQSGEKGGFRVMTECIFELGVLMRLQGHYEDALKHYENAQHFAAHYRMDGIHARIILEHAQIAFDQGVYVECLSLLHSETVRALPDNQHLQLLKSEALAAVGEFSQAYKLIKKITDSHAHNKQLLGRTYISLARVHEFNKCAQDAFDILTQAITLLEQSNDAIGLARAKCNLAVIIAQSGLDELHVAHNLLLQAKSTQEQSRDQLALAVTLQSLATVEKRMFF
jgi:tetratricopeptide (TPR) repeat protein